MQLRDPKAVCLSVVKTGCGTLGWALIGAGIGAVGAGLFGMLYGLLDGVTHAELGRIFATCPYFALCGAVAGGVTLGFARIIDSEGVTDLASGLPKERASKAIIFRKTCAPEGCGIARIRFPELRPSADENHAENTFGNPSLN